MNSKGFKKVKILTMLFSEKKAKKKKKIPEKSLSS